MTTTSRITMTSTPTTKGRGVEPPCLFKTSGVKPEDRNVLDCGTEFPKGLGGAARIVRAVRRRMAPSATPRHA